MSGAVGRHCARSETVPTLAPGWFPAEVYGRDVDVALLYFEDCPHWRLVDQRLAVLAAERPEVTVRHQLVESAEEAETWRFRGSPSVLIDGRDPFADPDAAIGLSCRLYPTPEGPAGAPTLDQLRDAIDAH